jgi:hypothetical protein
MKTKRYIFIFTGEFGYELLNWHAKIHKFSNLKPDVQIVTASTSATHILYQDFSDFFPLDELKVFRSAIADTYFLRRLGFKRDDLLDVLLAILRRYHIKKHILKYLRSDSEKFKSIFVFSDKSCVINGLQFGSRRWTPRLNPFRKRNFQEIYDNLPSIENQYTALDVDKQKSLEMQERLAGLGVKTPFILIQSAERKNFLKKRRNESALDELFEIFCTRLPAVQVIFSQVRNGDTQSNLQMTGTTISCKSLEDQVALIRLSAFCVFFSSGDYRSLHYVPPFCGIDVYSVTSSSVVSNSSIDKWNREVFNFGGKILPITAEALIFDPKYLDSFLSYLASKLND